jgi:polyisoprenoid-binding protein YceI
MEALVGLAIRACKAASPRLFRFRLLLALFAVLAAHVVVPAAHAQESVVELDAAQTNIQFTLSDILHTVHGEFRLKSGTIRFDPSTGNASGAIIVDAASGESGNGSRDRRMHREILESAKFAEISFTLTRVKGTLSPHDASHLEVTGQFHLHGKDHELTLPVDIQADGQQLQCTTRFVVPYVVWGLKNPSTFILRVSNKVTIEIHAVGRLVSPEASMSRRHRDLGAGA